MFYAKVFGAGKETIVALHGWSSIFDSAPEFIEALSQNYTVVLIYLPGYAGQPDDPRSQSLDWVLSEIAATADSLGFTRFHLLGHSMGARIATQFARRYPEKVGRLILVGARPPEKKHELSAWWLKLPGLPSLIRSIPGLEYRLVNRAFAYARRLTPNNQPKPFRPVNVSVHGAFDSLIAHLRRYSDPFLIVQPTLFIYGENDRMRPKKWPVGKELYLVPGAGHWVFNAPVDNLVGRIEKFLNR